MKIKLTGVPKIWALGGIVESAQGITVQKLIICCVMTCLLWGVLI